MNILAMELPTPVTENWTRGDLIAECRNGNREAMQELFVQNQRRVFSIALNFFGGNETIAEDITQQVFLKLFAKLDFRGDAEFTTWLYRITVNACIDETRKTRRILNMADFFGFAESRPSYSFVETFDSHEISGEVRSAVSGLKPKFRLPILLKYVEGLSYQEIADVLDCSMGTVASRLNRAHKILAGKLAHLKSEVQ